MGLALLIVFLVNLTPVQNFLARKAANILSEKLETKVAIGHIRIDLLNHLLVQGLYIEDQSGDTLLYAGEARVRITDWFIVRKDKPVLRYIGLHNTYGHLYRTAKSDKWNYQFVIDAFDTGKKDTTKKQNEFELDLERVDIRNVRFHMDDAWAGSDMDIDIGDLQLDAREIDIKKKLIDISSLEIKGVEFVIRDYDGGRPETARKKKKGIDTTAFNPAGWMVRADELSLAESIFRLHSSDREPYANEFDPSHMDITGIDIDVSNIRIKGDTVRGKMNNLAAKERCGIQIRQMHADVTVSPNVTICDELYLETNNSKLKDYYAMHYTRFPDFTDYVNKVVMVGRLKDSKVDSRDVAYFAPTLRQYPAILDISGEVAGSVDSLVGKKLDVSDGSSSLKGDLSMIGLPDINKTFINYQRGELFTTGAAVLKYAPALRNHPNIAVEKLSYVYYNGSFTGYIQNFAANGMLATNLGTVHSDIKLKMPGMESRRAVYSGTVATSGFNIGALLRQPLLGSAAVRAGISGIAFDPEHATVNLNAIIDRFDFNGYTYKSINAEGVLAHRKFDGNLIVNDPNLALAFYGSIDFSQPQLNINATANLLQSNLQALKLTKDSILAAADFDLNYQGNNIDDFSGYAKLYNINLVRNKNRLDIDSVYLQSSLVDGQKLLTLESNDVAASIKGNYQLSSLPYSVQYYVAGYLPNYIKAPSQNAPEQQLSFSVQTREIDSLLAVLAPNFKGFNNARVEGSLNTSQQQLTLIASIPYGYINDIHLHQVSISGTGNFRQLALQAGVENLVVGDDILSASMNVNTTLGNDSLNFNIATTSPDAFGTANLNGSAYASGDSLYLSLLPSEFFLNKTRWELPAGNSFVFSKDYLMVRNLKLSAGLQEITAYTENESTLQSLNVHIKDLDIAQLANMAGLSSYQPDGRVNGSIRLDHIFDGLSMNSNLVASEVKLGTDTLGTINLVGNYDGAKKILVLDPQSGVYRGNSSIRAAGSMSFDSTSRQQLSGYIQFTDAQLSWASPLVSGFLSNMSGTANGNINIGGSATKPDIDGSITLSNAATKIDVIGTYYRIPTAVVKVDNNNIDFGSVTLLDVHNNHATLTGGLSHDRFRNITFNRVRLTSPQFEVLNLKDYENNSFYGNLVADVESLTLTGSFEDIRMTVTAAPAARSHIYIPVKGTSDVGSYSYVSFKNYGQEQVVTKRKNNKFSLTIVGKMNPLAEMTLVLDPTTGDVINAKGNGTITLNIPANDDIKMYGAYEIEEGDYTFTFKQLFFRRNFIINSGSRISFNGLMSQTDLRINAVYTTRARLNDLLQENEKQIIPESELRDSKTAQNVSVLLYMSGSLQTPKLSFNIDLPEKRSEGTFAYMKLKRINQNDRELFDQVAALLLINTFIPPEGLVGSTAATGAINNVSEILSTTASSQLTNIVNKLLGDPNLSVELKYKNYNLSDPSTFGGVNRNEISLGVRKNLLDDRLIVELGSAYDWGRPTTSKSNTSNLNLAGDFRVQYLLSEDGRVRLNAFRTSNYDVLVDGNVYRGGVGISYRKTFDNLYEFFHKPKPVDLTNTLPPDTSKQVKGTW